MFWKRFVAVFVSTLLILVSACSLPGGTNLPGSTAVGGGTKSSPAAATAAVQTQVAGFVASTMAAQTALANAATPTLAATPTGTPSLTPTLAFTETPSLTPTPTLTFTPAIPMVSVSQDTNCRSGPGDAYHIRSILRVGESAEVVAQATSGVFWIIRIPSNPTMICWLWANYATVTGNWQALPAITPPPTPTPAASFDASYVGMVVCGGEYGFTFKISNPGSLTWESIKVKVTDTVTTIVKTHTRDSFKRFVGCVASGEDQNLEQGETGFATTFTPGQFAYDPTGHAMKANITVCSQDAQAGTCLKMTISFTP